MSTGWDLYDTQKALAHLYVWPDGGLYDTVILAPTFYFITTAIMGPKGSNIKMLEDLFCRSGSVRHVQKKPFFGVDIVQCHASPLGITHGGDSY